MKEEKREALNEESHVRTCGQPIKVILDRGRKGVDIEIGGRQVEK